MSLGTQNLLFGKHNVFLTCMYDAIMYRIFTFNDDVNFGLEFRQNKKSEWIPIGRSNKYMSYIEHNVSADGIIQKIEMQYKPGCKFSSSCYARISVEIKFDECLSDSEIPTFRCRILDGNKTLDRSNEVQLSLIGEKTIFLY